MHNDEEQQKKSLLKDMAKKGISNVIKKIPLKYKIIFIAIGGSIIFLLIFIVLIVPMIMGFGEESNSGSSTTLSYIESNSEDNYWWPIGGSEVITDEYGIEYAIGVPTTTLISSEYGEREDYYHDAIDITGGATQYIIAVAAGVVNYVATGCNNNGYSGNMCNGGLGNYIKIDHYNGTTTKYAHLLPDSITVNQGDTVKQGQIIGKMGNSGNSTGQHLHFEIKVSGVNQNPLDYISAEEPRPVTVTSGSGLAEGNEMLAMLQSWEGTGPTNGNNYVVYDDGYGTLTVGHGVTIGYNVQRFKERGIDTTKVVKGTQISKSIVDDIELEIVEEKRASVVNLLINNGISLEEYQIDALTIRMYNVGNVGGFPEKYKIYGISEGLRDNYMLTPVTSNGVYSEGLKRRREAEWNLFYNGIYTYNY